MASQTIAHPFSSETTVAVRRPEREFPMAVFNPTFVLVKGVWGIF
jgi:hypothetical protein